MLRLSGDPASVDPARIFFGSRGSKPQVFDRGIDESFLAELIKQGQDTDQPDAKGSKYHASTISRLSIPSDMIITTTKGKRLTPRDAPAQTPVHCPFHHDRHASAFIVESRTGTRGIHCSTCRQTFWLEGSSPHPYDFFDFDAAVRKARRSFDKQQDDKPLISDPGNLHRDLSARTITVTSDQYLRIGEIREGLTLIKSPKASGKTQALEAHLAKNSGSILLIGHRVALLRNTCRRLGLDLYLDQPEGPLSSRRLGVCLDSLSRLALPNLRTFSTIIIDESEQVLSHFLSETMSKGHRSPEKTFIIFKELLRRANQVMALDADLGWATFDTLTKICATKPGNGRRQKRQREMRIHLNDFESGQAIEVFPSDSQLVADLMQALSEGKRILVAANSKLRIDRLAEAINAEFEGKITLLKVTSETSGSTAVKQFVEAPRTHALEYQAILSSPSLGTGVDITFDLAAQEIDMVYGFCDALITTHLDFDQHLARVRNPGAIKVWITPRTFRFDTATDVVKKDLLRDGVHKTCLTGFDDHGRPQYQTGDAFTDMAALIVFGHRASKNSLKRNFIDLKRRQGAVINEVAADPGMTNRGTQFKQIGRTMNDKVRAERLLNAAPLDKPAFDELNDRIMDKEEVAETERWSLERTLIELFYRQRISEPLILLDERGRYRRKVECYEQVQAILAMPAIDVDQAFTAPHRSGQSLRRRFVKASSNPAMAVCYLLKQTPLMKDGIIREAAVITKDDLGDFVTAIIKHKAAVENALEIEVRSDVHKKPMMVLSGVLDRIGLKVSLVAQTRSKGEPVRRYQLCPDALGRIRKLAAARAAKDDWPSLYAIDGWDATELD